MARPEVPFDWHLVESLMEEEASESYIAERLLIGEKQEVNKKSITAKIKLLQRRIKKRFGCSFVQFREQKLEGKRIRLRKWQWRAAERGNTAMMIWLGKQYLDQTDKRKDQIDHTTKGNEIQASPVIVIPANGSEAAENE